MGFGLPGALAAALAYPERQIVCLTGDGGLTMVIGDFLTALKYNLPVKVFVMNNKRLGMIMQEQKVEGYEGWQTDLHDFSFATFAENAGGLGIKVTEPNELGSSRGQSPHSKNLQSWTLTLTRGDFFEEWNY